MRLTLALLWALDAQNPVHVDVTGLSDEARAQRLHGDLLVRLLEEGYPVAESTQAAVTLAITQNEDGSFDVLAETVDDRSQHSVPGGPASAVRLELLHRSMQVLHSVRLGDAGLAGASTVSIEVSDPERRKRLPDPDLVQTALTAGLVVSPATADPTWRFCVLHSKTGWSYLRVAGRESCEAAFVLLQGGTGDDRKDFVEALERESSAVRTRDGLQLEGEPPESGEHDRPRLDQQTPAISDPSSAAETDSTGPGWIWMSAGAGALFRLQPVDPNIPLAFGVTHRIGLGVMGRASLIPSMAPEPLRIFETAVGVGPAWHGPLHRRVGLGVGLLVGVLVHRYRFADENPTRTTYFDFQVPVWLPVRIAAGFSIAPEIEFGLSTRAREHRVDAVSAWGRSAIRLGVGVSFLYVWGWQ